MHPLTEPSCLDAGVGDGNSESFLVHDVVVIQTTRTVCSDDDETYSSSGVLPTERATPDCLSATAVSASSAVFPLQLCVLNWHYVSHVWCRLLVALASLSNEQILPGAKPGLGMMLPIRGLKMLQTKVTDPGWPPSVTLVYIFMCRSVSNFLLWFLVLCCVLLLCACLCIPHLFVYIRSPGVLYRRRRWCSQRRRYLLHLPCRS